MALIIMTLTNKQNLEREEMNHFDLLGNLGKWSLVDGSKRDYVFLGS
jgi:hypothetical protein